MTITMTGGSREEPLRWLRHAARRRPRRRGLSAPYALPTGFAALFAVGTIAAALNGRLPATGVLITCAVVVTIMSAISQAAAAVPLGVIGWLTVIGFSRPPYADLQPAGATAAYAAITMAACALAGASAGWLFRYWPAGVTLESVDRRKERGIDARRQLAGAALAVAVLPALTALLAAWRPHLNLADDLLSRCTRSRSRSRRTCSRSCYSSRSPSS